MSQQDKSLAANQLAGSGVQALIDRLKSEGVSAGQAEADRILQKAKEKASQIVAAAEAEAEAVRAKAHADAEKEQTATRDSLKVAARDLVLSLRNDLESRVLGEASRLVSQTLQDPEFLQRLILEMAGKAKVATGMSEDEPLQFVLPEKAVTFEELKKSPEDVSPGTLTHFVLALAADVLRDGVSFTTAPGVEGIRLKLLDRDISIDMTDEAIATLLTSHLQPRLRAVMEGVLR